MAARINFLVRFLLVVGQRYHGGCIPQQTLFLGLAFTLIGAMLHFATPAGPDDDATDGMTIKILLLVMAVPLLFVSYAHPIFPAVAGEAAHFAQAVLESLVEFL